MATAVRDKIISFLGAGVSQAVAAEAVGVTPGYVSQLLEDPAVREEIALARASRVEEAIKSDNTLEDAEKKALKAVVDRMHVVRNAGEAANIFKILNGARRKATPEAGVTAPTGAQQVMIVIPKAAQVMIKMSSDNQVVAIDNRSMAPLPSKALPLLSREVQLKKAVEAITTRSAPETVVSKPIAPHVQELAEKAAATDAKRAKYMLADMTVLVDGVEIVI